MYHAAKVRFHVAHDEPVISLYLSVDHRIELYQARGQLVATVRIAASTRSSLVRAASTFRHM